MNTCINMVYLYAIFGWVFNKQKAESIIILTGIDDGIDAEWSFNL